ncbi:MAG TPA: hypothetical protein VLB82_01675 [Thermodesulfobacteriota bacterium]|nr:hypothetical protein [Thermodesulfobacteriota bacterium]
MKIDFSKDDLEKALSSAGSAHHDYEVNTLNGVRDEMWPGFYAAYVLGRLGDFAPASVLNSLLESAPSNENWAASTAEYVIKELT